VTVGGAAGAAGVAEEAARLADTLRGVAASWQEQRAGGTHTGPTCRACPICRLVALVDEVRPEVLGHLADATASLAAAVAEVAHARAAAAAESGRSADAAPEGGAQDDAAPGDGARAGGGPRERSTVQEIPVEG
jgi:hypothetical protein